MLYDGMDMEEKYERRFWQKKKKMYQSGVSSVSSRDSPLMTWEKNFNGMGQDWG